MILQDIFAAFQSELDKSTTNTFKLFIDNNSNEFMTSVDKSVTIDDRMQELETQYIVGICSTGSGERVSLQSLYTTSFKYQITFSLDTSKNIDNDLENLTQAFNGYLKTITDVDKTWKYVVTFNTPTAVGGIDQNNGNYYQQVMLSGNILITDDSLLGNEISLTLDTTPVNGLLGYNPSINVSFDDPGEQDTTNTPLITTKYITTTYNLLIHAKNGDAFSDKLFSWLNDVETITLNEYPLDITYNGVTKSVTVSIESINLEASINGFWVYNVNLIRTVTLNE